MARHRQKDLEAGGDGLGVIESRKRLWRDGDGNIVSKRPSQDQDQDQAQAPTPKKQAVAAFTKSQQHAMESYNTQMSLRADPLSPPKSMLSSESLDQTTHPLPELLDQNFLDPIAGSDMFDFLANSSWGTAPPHSSMYMQAEMPSDEMFNPDTGRFNIWF